MLDMMSNEWVEKLENEAQPKRSPDGFRRVIRALRTQERGFMQWPTGDTKRIILLLLAMAPLRAQQIMRIINGEKSFQHVFNTNLCENRVVTSKGQAIMLQAASIYTQGKGGAWDGADMLAIMIEIATTSIKVLASDLFNQMVLKSHEEEADDEGC